MPHEEYYEGERARRLLAMYTSKPLTQWPARLIVSYRKGDLQLYIKVKTADELATPADADDD
jgi:hypothetical protein